MAETTPETPAAKLSPEAKMREEVLKTFGISAEDLENLKRQVGKIEVIPIGGRLFVYRSLKRSEVKAIKSIQGLDEQGYEEQVAARCLVLPRLTIDELKMDDAGLPATLAEAIAQFSGYAPDALPVKI